MAAVFHLPPWPRRRPRETMMPAVYDAREDRGMYDAMLAESVTITGHNGEEIEAYSARTLRAFAAGGLNAVMPNLYHREAPGAAPDDAMAAARASGAIPIPDERIVGEVAGAAGPPCGGGDS